MSTVRCRRHFAMLALSKPVGISLQSSRCFSVFSQVNQKNLYDVLQITPKASQAEVKSAFYKLSKKHHPDANANNPDSTGKFQEILEAYEVLGNESARKRYDVGMPHGLDGSPAKPGFKAPEDPQAAFYKSRLMNKMNSPSTSRTYNFDAWTKEHYSASIRSNRDLRTTRQSDGRVRYDREDPIQLSINKLAIGLLGFTFAGYVLSLLMGNHDSPSTQKRQRDS